MQGLIHIRRCADTAAKTLGSCRTELKNCLFDLRGNALGQRDMDAAIRLSVAPVIAVHVEPFLLEYHWYVTVAELGDRYDVIFEPTFWLPASVTEMRDAVTRLLVTFERAPV